MAVPIVHIDQGPVPVDELKREFVLSRKRTVQKPEQGTIIDFIHDILDDVFNWKVTD